MVGLLQFSSHQAKLYDCHFICTVRNWLTAAQHHCLIVARILHTSSEIDIFLFNTNQTQSMAAKNTSYLVKVGPVASFGQQTSPSCLKSLLCGCKIKQPPFSIPYKLLFAESPR